MPSTEHSPSSESGLGVAPWRPPAKFRPPKRPIQNSIICDRPWQLFKGSQTAWAPVEKSGRYLGRLERSRYRYIYLYSSTSAVYTASTRQQAACIFYYNSAYKFPSNLVTSLNALGRGVELSTSHKACMYTTLPCDVVRDKTVSNDLKLTI